MHSITRDCRTVLPRLVTEIHRTRWTGHRVPNLRPRPASRSFHSLHDRRDLNYPIEDGVGDFLPPNALKTVVEWQDGLLDRLSDQVRGTSLALRSVFEIISESSGDAQSIRAFNLACLAANNSFFLDGLNPQPPKTKSGENKIPDVLRLSLSRSFPDVGSLEERFVASAMGMVSSGWLWLVADNRGEFAVVPTFGAGTLLVRSRQHWTEVEQNNLARQPTDWLCESIKGPTSTPSTRGGSSPSSPVSGVKATSSKPNPNTATRSLSSSSALAAMKRSAPSVRDDDTASQGNTYARHMQAHLTGSKLYPLCCLSLYEHTWLSAGLGVWGKEEYVRRFFSVIDWARINTIYGNFHKKDKEIIRV